MEDPAIVPESADAFGAALRDVLGGGRGGHVVERDDGFVEVMDATVCFTVPEAWPEADVAVLERVAGRVLDLGAGAGRHSLALAAAGNDVVALDVSPGAIAVCKARGVAATFLGSVDALAAAEPPAFDAVTMMGHNLALLESRDRAGPMLDALRHVLRPGGVVIGTSLDPYLTDEPGHLAYHQTNRDRGRFAGQIRMRVRFRHITGPWFDWLFLSPDELIAVAERAGWRAEIVIAPSPTYLAELRPM